MTYAELLRTTADRKQKAICQLNAALRDPACGFLVKAEIERKPGSVAWLYLAQDFCQAIAEHVDELMESADQFEKDEIMSIYYGYYDDDPDLYQRLPIEAQLFDE